MNPYPCVGKEEIYLPDKEFVLLDQDETRLTTLQNNVKAVKQVIQAVASTLGPKGLDTMLVNSENKATVTNDGVTILQRMELHHPAAKMIVNVAKAQQEQVGDGTTTATLLAVALIEEGVKQIMRGVPVTKVITGIQKGINFALNRMKEKARPIYDLDDEWLQRIAFTASRENEDITLAVIEATHMLGRETLMEKNFKFSSCVVSYPHAKSNVFSGILINKNRLNIQMPHYKKGVRVLVLNDSLKPEVIEQELRSTEEGFAQQERLKEDFYVALEHLIHLNVGLIVTSDQVDPYAEDVLTDAGVMIISEVEESDLLRIAEYTGARLIKRNGLKKSLEEIKTALRILC